MPAEILWVEGDTNENFYFTGEVLTIRFRRPQLIKAEDIASAINKLLSSCNSSEQYDEAVQMMAAVLRKDTDRICQGIEKRVIDQVVLTDNHFSCLIQIPSPRPRWSRAVIIDENAMYRPSGQDGEKMPPVLLSGEKHLSVKKVYAFPIKIMPSYRRLDESLLRVIHNVPLEEHPLMGSCTWFNYTQPLTTVKLIISGDWFDAKRDGLEGRHIWNIASDLYWLFQSWVNKGVLVKNLTNKGYDLNPLFDSVWTDCVMEDQCQDCGKIHATMPWNINEVKVGKSSKNICHCRRIGARKNGTAIVRKFKVIGAYPISPGEAEHASCEAMIQADSAD